MVLATMTLSLRGMMKPQVQILISSQLIPLSILFLCTYLV
uniref:Bromodomain and PHD finger-containing protein 3 n=1 Tax=Rhizophora mucronata TaxID=61149 RepID=A0A2P2JH07_RHIMU